MALFKPSGEPEARERDDGAAPILTDKPERKKIDKELSGTAGALPDRLREAHAGCGTQYA
ncbi:hypothetical protein [Burkholderia sp. 22313]|uniref:hypothetical protein n=1 Tax=Burkholderia sp. 22313 TaxID=3453908 RepID=UPI003F8758DB